MMITLQRRGGTRSMPIGESLFVTRVAAVMDLCIMTC